MAAHALFSPLFRLEEDLFLYSSVPPRGRTPTLVPQASPGNCRDRLTPAPFIETDKIVARLPTEATLNHAARHKARQQVHLAGTEPRRLHGLVARSRSDLE